MSPVTYPDPRGAATLRSQLASYLAIARGIHCAPDQIVLTAGYRGGLGLTLAALQLAGRTAWMEEPGYMVTRIPPQAASRCAMATAGAAKSATTGWCSPRAAAWRCRHCRA